MSDEKNTTTHVSVLCREILDSLVPVAASKLHPLFVDCTLGGGGHTEALLKQFPALSIIALDQDDHALARAKERLQQFEGRVVYLRENFANLSNVLAALRSRFPERAGNGEGESGGEFRVDALIADLGLSSDQLSDSARGFSFRGREPLDMRMDTQSQLSAAAVLNEYSLRDLERVFLQGGLRRGAHALAKRVINERPLETTAEFRVICEDVLTTAKRKAGRKHAGGSAGATRAHIATVPFQAVRIEVNGELEAIRSLMASIPNILSSGGRAAIITFHSLEDELVTKELRRYSLSRQIRRGLPPQPALGKMVNRQAICPTAREIRANSRARSARLRVFERGEIDQNNPAENLE